MRTPAEIKRLHRSQTDKILAGVCGGFAAYFSVDSGMVRLAMVALTVLTGVFPGAAVYIIAAIILPKEPIT